MPDAPADHIEVGASSVLVQWDAVRLAGPGTLHLTTEAIVIEAGGGALHAVYDEIRGGAWRTGTLTIHGEKGTAAVQAAQGLDRAWVQLIERACPMPELARSHRTLGSRRGGAADAQERFLAPLLHARRRLNAVNDLDERVAAVEVSALRERVEAALQGIARDAYPASHPERRSLEAELEEALAAFFEGLRAMESAAAHFRSAPEAIRFHAWREWMTAMSRAFALADTGWAAAAPLLPNSMKP
jgi:hypothetical protein